jgi:NADH:ubiquinone oxidoreductase subunit H
MIFRPVNFDNIFWPSNIFNFLAHYIWSGKFLLSFKSKSKLNQLASNRSRIQIISFNISVIFIITKVPTNNTKV